MVEGAGAGATAEEAGTVAVEQADNGHVFLAHYYSIIYCRTWRQVVYHVVLPYYAIFCPQQFRSRLLNWDMSLRKMENRTQNRCAEHTICREFT
jgi:hypothetical protein